VFREVIVLRELEELSYEQIAETMAIPLGTVMSRLARARALLRASIGRDD
jgi:RNA polymerase sigma-70 factor (ECF subfamily)